MEHFADENMFLPLSDHKAQLVAAAAAQLSANRKRPHSDVDIDISDDEESSSYHSHSPNPEDNKRVHHNKLERNRRDVIKKLFDMLNGVIHTMHGEKSSRAAILRRAHEQIVKQNAREHEFQLENAKLRQEKEILEAKLAEVQSRLNSISSSVSPPAVTSPMGVSLAAPFPMQTPSPVNNSASMLPSMVVSPFRQTAVNTLVPQTAFDNLSNIMAPTPQLDMLALTQMLLNQSFKLEAPMARHQAELNGLVPDLQTRLFANNLMFRDKQLPVQF